MYTLYVQLCELRVLAFFFFFELPTILKSSALIEPDWPVKSPFLLHLLLRCTSVWHWQNNNNELFDIENVTKTRFQSRSKSAFQKLTIDKSEKRRPQKKKLCVEITLPLMHGPSLCGLVFGVQHRFFFMKQSKAPKTSYMKHQLQL